MSCSCWQGFFLPDPSVGTQPIYRCLHVCRRACVPSSWIYFSFLNGLLHTKGVKESQWQRNSEDRSFGNSGGIVPCTGFCPFTCNRVLLKYTLYHLDEMNRKFSVPDIGSIQKWKGKPRVCRSHAAWRSPSVTLFSLKWQVGVLCSYANNGTRGEGPSAGGFNGNRVLFQDL